MIQFNATDEDLAPFGTVAFSVEHELQGTTVVANPKKQLFAIDAATGVVSLKKSLCTKALHKVKTVIV